MFSYKKLSDGRFGVHSSEGVCITSHDNVETARKMAKHMNSGGGFGIAIPTFFNSMGPVYLP